MKHCSPQWNVWNVIWTEYPKSVQTVIHSHTYSHSHGDVREWGENRAYGSHSDKRQQQWDIWNNYRRYNISASLTATHPHPQTSRVCLYSLYVSIEKISIATVKRDKKTHKNHAAKSERKVSGRKKCRNEIKKRSEKNPWNSKRNDVNGKLLQKCTCVRGACHACVCEPPNEEKSECVRVRNVNLSKLTQILDFQKASGCSLAGWCLPFRSLSTMMGRWYGLEPTAIATGFSGIKFAFPLFLCIIYLHLITAMLGVLCAVCRIRCAQSKASDKHSTLGEIAKNVYAHLGRRARRGTQNDFSTIFCIHSFSLLDGEQGRVATPVETRKHIEQ